MPHERKGRYFRSMAGETSGVHGNPRTAKLVGIKKINRWLIGCLFLR